MVDYVDISVDLETWGKRAGFDIRSIGACLFNIHTGQVCMPEDEYDLCVDATFYTACDNPMIYISGNPDNEESYGRTYDLKRDPETIAWWDKQSEEAKTPFQYPIDLKQALIKFARWLNYIAGDCDNNRHIRLWSHGSAFDPGILEGAYYACGLTPPWFYRSPRDTRTIFDNAGIRDHSAWVKSHLYGIPHHALHDSITQARAICAAHKRIRIIEG